MTEPSAAPVLRFADERAVRDLEQFATRARRVSDTGMRLHVAPAAGPSRTPMLAQWVSVLQPAGLGDGVPVVLGLRTVPLATADGVGSARRRAAVVKPDVVLMDMRMPAMSGLEAVQALARAGALPPTIILTTFDDDQLVLAGIKAGAKGYLLKDVSLDQLVGAIRTVANGGSLVQPAMTQRLLSGLEHMRNEFVSLDRPDPLTDRETEILRLMAGGFSNKEIANSLGVAEGTIKNHVSNILSKLGVRDRTRAVLKAFELQLV